MRNLIAGLIMVGSAVVGAASSATAALVVTTSIYEQPTVGAGTPLALQSIATPSTASVTGAGYSIAFSNVAAGQGVVNGALASVYAVPIAGSTTQVTGGMPEYLTGDYGSALTTNQAQAGNYLSTGGPGGTIAITFAAPQAAFSLLWGSIDASNELQLFSNGALVGTILGSTVEATPGFTSDGDQGPGGSAYVSIDDTAGTFNEVIASSNVISFEFAAVIGSAVPIATPEPLGVALFGFGLLTLGTLRRRA